MNLLILGRRDSHARVLAYLGTERPHPSYREDLPPQHEVNQGCLWFIREGGERGVVHDLAKARRLVDSYNQLGASPQFELVEVTRNQDPPSAGTKFLGFDLSYEFNNSLLSWGLQIHHEGNEVRDLPAGLAPLCHLVQEHFRPKLNTNGLFDDYETAKFCLGCMLALNRLVPDGLFENPQYAGFEVLGLYGLEANAA